MERWTSWAPWEYPDMRRGVEGQRVRVWFISAALRGRRVVSWELIMGERGRKGGGGKTNITAAPIFDPPAKKPAVSAG